MKQFISIAETVQNYTSAQVAPLEGSPLAQAVATLLPNREITEDEVIATGLEDARDDSIKNVLGGYAQITEEMIFDMVAVAKPRLVFLQNVVAPFIDKYAQSVSDACENAVQSVDVLDYDVNMFDLPEIAHSAHFQKLLNTYIERYGSTVEAPPMHQMLPQEDESVIVATLESGFEEWDKMVSSLLADMGEQGANQAISRIIRSAGTEKRPINSKTGTVQYLPVEELFSDYVVTFLFINSILLGGYENEDKIVQVKLPVRRTLERTLAALSTTIDSMIKKHLKTIDEGFIIREIDHVNHTVTCYDETFRDYIANDGEIEVIKALAILDNKRPGEILKTTVETLIDHKEHYLKQFEKNFSEIQADAKDKAESNAYATIVPKLMAQLDTISALELGLNNIDEVAIENYASELLDKIGIEAVMESPKTAANQIACKAIWPNASFDKFVARMNEEGRKYPSFDSRQCAYRAFVAEIVENLLKNVKRV